MVGGFLYITTNKNHTTLYVGVTSDLRGRIIKHRLKKYQRSFSSRYNVTKHVYFEIFPTIAEAIAREKQLKAGSRKQKINLITRMNPEWRDLHEMLN